MAEQASRLDVVQGTRTRVTIAQVNAGATLVAGVAGMTLRLIDAFIISIGGAAAAVTTVDIASTQSSSAVKLVACAQAALTEAGLLRAGASGAAVLAAGVSFVANDAGAAITIGKTGSAVTTATHFDVVLLWAAERA